MKRLLPNLRESAKIKLNFVNGYEVRAVPPTGKSTDVNDVRPSDNYNNTNADRE